MAIVNLTACRVGHETQWTHSKLAEPCDDEEAEETLDACWNCIVPLNIGSGSQAVHLGVYAVQSSQAADVSESSSSFLSTVQSILKRKVLACSYSETAVYATIQHFCVLQQDIEHKQHNGHYAWPFQKLWLSLS